MWISSSTTCSGGGGFSCLKEKKKNTKSQTNWHDCAHWPNHRLNFLCLTSSSAFFVLWVFCELQTSTHCRILTELRTANKRVGSRFTSNLTVRIFKQKHEGNSRCFWSSAFLSSKCSMAESWLHELTARYLLFSWLVSFWSSFLLSDFQFFAWNVSDSSTAWSIFGSFTLDAFKGIDSKNQEISENIE